MLGKSLNWWLEIVMKTFDTFSSSQNDDNLIIDVCLHFHTK